VCTSHEPEILLKEAEDSLDYIVKDLEGVSVKLVGDKIEFTLTVLQRN